MSRILSLRLIHAMHALTSTYINGGGLCFEVGGGDFFFLSKRWCHYHSGLCEAPARMFG